MPRRLLFLIVVLTSFSHSCWAAKDKSKAVDTSLYGPQPSGEIQEVADHLFFFQSVKVTSDSSGVKWEFPSEIITHDASGLHAEFPKVILESSSSFPWCYPKRDEQYCGWMVRYSSDEGSETDVLFRNGRVITWTGSLDGIYLLNSAPSVTLDVNLLNGQTVLRLPPDTFVDKETGTLIRVKFDTDRGFKGWRSTIYGGFSHRFGFFLRAELERAGFSRVSDVNDAPASSPYELSVTLEKINEPAVGASLKAEVIVDASLTRDKSLLFSKSFDYDEKADLHEKLNAAERGGLAMDYSMAGSAELIVNELRNFLRTQAGRE